MRRVVSYRPSFQGDLCVRRIDAIPPSAAAQLPANDRHVLAHSETGHHHVIDSRSAQMLIDRTNEFIAYLDVAGESEIVHLRDHDTHAPLTLLPGKYEVRRQREYTPEGWRRAQD